MSAKKREKASRSALAQAMRTRSRATSSSGKPERGGAVAENVPGERRSSGSVTLRALDSAAMAIIPPTGPMTQPLHPSKSDAADAAPAGATFVGGPAPEAASGTPPLTPSEPAWDLTGTAAPTPFDDAKRIALDGAPRAGGAVLPSLDLGGTAGASAAMSGGSRAAAKAPAYRFAQDYSVSEVLNSPVKAEAFVQRYLEQEGRFFAEARDPRSGLTFDGVNLDPRTGEVASTRRLSAASKEGLDLGVWIKALSGDAKAAQLVAGGDVRAARAQAASVLAKKLDAYEAFHREYPGYGGFLPWFRHTGNGRIAPASDWARAAPGLDNGEWVWTMVVAEKALRDAGHPELADRYAKYNELLRVNAVKMFFDPETNKVRADVQISDPRSPTATYRSAKEGEAGMIFMDGPSGVHEGVMMNLFVTLLGKGLPDGASEKIWAGIDMKRVESKHGTTWEACWGSSHESWAYLFLPMRDLPEYRDLFRIREKIRAHNAVERGYPGFSSSILGPEVPGKAGYLSSGGIEGISAVAPEHNDVFAFYGAFPMLLEFSTPKPDGKNYGLAWLLNMLHAPKAQGPLGSGESGTNDGRASAPFKTMDGSVPISLALMGGVEREAAETLRALGVYDRFAAIMKHQYDKAFGTAPLREPVGFVAPTATVPTDRSAEYAAAEP